MQSRVAEQRRWWEPFVVKAAIRIAVQPIADVPRLNRLFMA
jgi:hypothetical protein